MSAGQSQRRQERSRVARTIAVKSRLKTCGRMSKNQCIVAAEITSVRAQAGGDAHAFHRTSARTANVARSMPMLSHAAASGETL
jgi:hypothetical protein